MKSKLLIVAILFHGLLYGQNDKESKLHTPAEILKIMTDSKISYNVSIFDGNIQCKDRSTDVNTNDKYQEKKGNAFVSKDYKFSKDVYAIVEEGERNFRSGRSDSARYYYKQALDLYPECAMLLTYIGQTYEQEKNAEKSIKYYLKAIEVNYFDYMAHWYLGYAYYKQGNYKTAVDEVTIAYIINRNNPRLLKELKEIYEAADYTYHDWCFQPQMHIEKKADGTIDVAFESHWTGFALAKALWTYEPGYKESMGGKEDSYTSVEDKECLLTLAMGMANDSTKSWRSIPPLSALQNAIEKKMFQEYLYFEIILPQYPASVYMLPKSFIEEIKTYVKKVRTDS